MEISRAASRPVIKFLLLHEKLIAEDYETPIEKRRFGLLRLAFFQTFKRWPQKGSTDDK